jgi:hypothetical protein
VPPLLVLLSVGSRSPPRYGYPGQDDERRLWQSPRYLCHSRANRGSEGCRREARAGVIVATGDNHGAVARAHDVPPDVVNVTRPRGHIAVVQPVPHRAQSASERMRSSSEGTQHQKELPSASLDPRRHR